MPRHFIQHIGGEPIALRYVLFESVREAADGTLTAEWTEDETQRQEWDSSHDAHTVRDQLGVGVVLHVRTDSQPTPDEEAILQKRHLRHINLPPPETPIPDEDLPWWQR